MPRRPLALTLAAVALAAVGCGNDRTEPPDVAAIRPAAGFADATFPAAGIALRSPRGWRTEPGSPPLVATIATGAAKVAIWRYARVEELPSSEQELEAARDALVAEVMTRDPGFEVQSTRIVRKDGLDGVEIVGVGTVSGARRRVRSLHAYEHGAEVVVDASAPVEDFPRVDEETFGPLARSVRLSPPS